MTIKPLLNVKGQVLTQLTSENNKVLSEKCLTSDLSSCGKSLTYTKKNRGQSTESCGTVAVIDFQIELERCFKVYYVKKICLNKESFHIFHYFEVCKEHRRSNPMLLISSGKRRELLIKD